MDKQTYIAYSPGTTEKDNRTIASSHTAWELRLGTCLTYKHCGKPVASRLRALESSSHTNT